MIAAAKQIDLSGTEEDQALLDKLTDILNLPEKARPLAFKKVKELLLNNK